MTSKHINTTYFDANAECDRDFTELSADELDDLRTAAGTAGDSDLVADIDAYQAQA